MTNANLELYDRVRAVPQDAQSAIGGGRLKGKTDINPMWRIQTLTREFGPCGIGWKADVQRFWTADGVDGEVAAFCEIELRYKQNGEWSDAIVGIGGSMFIEKEEKGLHTNDECFKMAYTDAISVACKALGVGADVYWNKNESKYSNSPAKKTYSSSSSSASDVEYARKLEIKYGTYKGRILGELTPKELNDVANGGHDFLKKHALVLLGTGAQTDACEPVAEEDMPF